MAKKDDPRRFLHPATIARISRLDLRARYVVEGFISGMHKSPFFGHSVEFVQHREYSIGDDIRHLDSTSFRRLCSLRDDLPERGAFPADHGEVGRPHIRRDRDAKCAGDA